MLDRLLTEQPNPASAGIDTLPTEAMLRIFNDQDCQVAEAVGAVVPAIARAVDAVVTGFQKGGRLFYIGAGTSGRLGVLDASECRPTFNVPEEMVQGIMAGGERALAHPTEASEDDAEAGARDLLARGFRLPDVLVGIAASGRTPYVLGAVAAARRLGATTIGISCSPQSELSQAVDIAIEPLPGPEVIAGSTRLKAGTATKLVLNMLSSASMIRMGHVFGNLMVNVQPTNEKLRARACRIISQAAQVTEEAAAGFLDASGGTVKVAILMARLGLDRNEAERRLHAAGGRISEALQSV